MSICIESSCPLCIAAKKYHDNLKLNVYDAPVTKRKGDWMQTYTGRQFWPLDPRPEEIYIEDIAHSLSNMCRFLGHCKNFYSVAEHSVRVSWYIKDAGGTLLDQYAGLLHDASEAYLVDVPRPVKPYLTNYKELELNMEKCIETKFNLQGANWELVKKGDNVLCATEKRDLMPNAPVRWTLTEEPYEHMDIYGWTPQEAKRGYLNWFDHLNKLMKNEKSL